MAHILQCTGYELMKTKIVQALDCCLYDIHNKRYIDFEAGVWCATLGHNHPRINQIIKQQINKLTHIGYRYNVDLIDVAAEKVLNITQIQNGKCIFLSSGSEAVELSTQIVRKINDKPLLLTFSDSYLAAYGSAGKKSLEEWHCFDWSVCKNCDIKECNLSCKYLREIPFNIISGFVFEPGSSSGLVKFPPKKLIQAIVNNIKQHDGLIAINEITTGMGRTGEWFGFQHYDLEPDIIAIGKGLGNGYPVSVVVMTNNIADQLEKDGFRYAQSHQNDPLGCAVANEVISVLKEEGLIDRSKKIGTYFLHELDSLKDKYELIKEVRGKGLMIAVEFINSNNYFSLPKLFQELWNSGFIIGFKPAANIIRFFPPLIISEEKIKKFLGKFETLLSEQLK